MRPELPILSFLSTVLLLALAFLHAKSRNIAVLALISWLLIGNIIQGVNSILWAGNETVRNRVWCDISSKLLLGSRIALPATCACICAHLHYLSSARNTRLRRFRILFELMSSLFLPVLYMALHLIVQDHRFVLVEDFGCVASTYTSPIALILVWLSPIILCVTSVTYAGLALRRHARRNKLALDQSGVSSRLVTVSFLRPLITAVFTSLFSLFASIFDVYASITLSHGFRRWTSLSRVHSSLPDVLVVASTDRLQITKIEVFWWLMPSSTMVFGLMAALGLLLCSEDGSIVGFRSVRKWFRSTVLRHPDGKDTFIQSFKNLSQRLTMTSPTPPPPVHLSGTGWDDTLKESVRSKPRLYPLACNISLRPASPTASECEHDTAFQESTLAYLKSPTGRETVATRFQASSPTSGPISQVGPRWSTLLATPPPALHNLPSTSPTHSILSSPWPRPPSNIPSPSISLQQLTSHPSTETLAAQNLYAPDHERHHSQQPSLSSFTGSLASIIEAHGYTPDPDIFLHGVSPPTGPTPFQHAGIPMIAVDGRAPASQPRRTLSVSSKGSMSSRHLRRKDSYGDAVYMTVVHETQPV